MPYASVPTGRSDIERRVVQRAWADPEFRARLLRDPKAAVATELGVQLPEPLEIQVIEERPDFLCIVIPVDLSSIPESTVRVMTGTPPGAAIDPAIAPP